MQHDNTTIHKHSSYSVVKRVFKEYVFHYKIKLIMAVICMIIVAATTAFLAWLVKPALDGIFVNKDSSLFIIIPVAVILVSMVKGLADYWQTYLLKFIGQSVVNDMQLSLYRSLIKSDVQYLNQHSSGYFLAKFTNDINNVKSALSQCITSFAQELLLIVFLVGIMFYNDVILSLIAFIVFPSAVIPIIKGGKKIKKVTYDTQQKFAMYIKHLDERFHNIKLVKSFCAEDYEIKEGKKFLDQLLGFYTKSIKVESWISPIMEMLGGIAIASIILYSGYQVLHGASTTGSFFSFIVAFISAYKPMKSIAGLNLVIQMGVASANRVFMVLDQENEVENRQHKKDFAFKKGIDIDFNNVSFSHATRAHILKNVSFAIPSGSLIAVVGESGSGKSTVVDLLLKFYLPEKGKVLFNGVDTAEVSTKSIRNCIAVITQDVMLFDKSIKDNILYAKHNGTMKEIEEAAKIAGLHDFILSLPDKYDTLVGKFGLQLSGGQRQKIAIARAVLKNSQIMIFDEATSALDQISEQLIKESVRKLTNSGKSIIFITHRLATIKDVDMIYVMSKGKLAEHGTHEDLIKNKAEYYRLYNKKTT